MLGRVGRLFYYEKGKVYFFVEFGRKYLVQMEGIEDEVVFKFLIVFIELVQVEWSDEFEQDNVLVYFCVFNRLDVIEEV